MRRESREIGQETEEEEIGQGAEPSVYRHWKRKSLQKTKRQKKKRGKSATEMIDREERRKELKERELQTRSQ